MKALRYASLLWLLVLCVALPWPMSITAQARVASVPVAEHSPISAAARLTLDNSTIQRIRNRGNLMIAGVLFDYQPFGYLDAQGESVGFEVDLIRAIAKEWAIDVQFVPVTPSTRIQSLVAGQVDLVAAALPHTAAAESLIDFSQSYFTDTPALLVRADNAVTLSTLAGKTVAAIQGDEATTPLQTALAAAATTVTMMPFQEYAPAVLALKAGQADALLADSAYLAPVSDALPIGNVLLTLPVSHTFGIGVAQGDDYFRNLVDASLATLQQKGAFAELYAKWFPTQPAPQVESLPGLWPYTFANSPSDLTLPPTSRWLQLQTRGKLLVGVAYDFAPFGFLGDDGQLRGFDIDLSREFARRWLGDADAVELVRVTPTTAIPLLMAGQVDLIAAALPLTWANRAMINFSPSYFLDGQSILTRANSPIQALSDLDQRVVAVIGGDQPIQEMVTLAADTTAAFAPTLLPFQELRLAQQALLADQIDALIGSSVALAQLAQLNPDLDLALEYFVAQPYAIGMPQFDALLRDQVNLTLQAMQTDGVYTTLYERWFADPLTATTVKRPTATLESNQQARLQPTAMAQAALPLAPSNAPSSTVPAPQLALILQPTMTPNALTLSTTLPVLIATGTVQAVVVAENMNPTAASPGATTITIRPGLNVNARRAPTVTAPIVEVLVGGTTWPLLTFSADGEWVQLQLAGRVQAWVATQLVLLQEVTQLPPVTATFTRTPSPVNTVSPAVTTTPTPRFATSLTHRVQAADTLATIAKQYYGNQGLWHLIYEANRELIGDDPNAIPIGATLVIPPPP